MSDFTLESTGKVSNQASGDELEQLRAELQDLRILYQATIEHGEAVEDQLAEINIELQKTQNRLSEELSEAINYVLSILPEPRTSSPSIDWLLVPSTELGGDSFGYHDIDDDHVALYLLDVCGHGIGAALLSVAAINVIRSAALPSINFRNPGEVLSALNAAFPMEKHNNMYFTIWYGVFNKQDLSLDYSSGGHPPSILVKGSGETEELSTPSIAIGMFPDIAYTTQSVKVQNGDKLYIISDGTFEVETSSGGMLDFADFKGKLRASQAPEDILVWIKSLNGPGALPDDFSLLSIKF